MLLSERDSSYVLARSRQAEDDSFVQSARIARIDANGVVVVERWGWLGERMLDYPVRLPSKAEPLK
jgi:hypothetical protein